MAAANPPQTLVAWIGAVASARAAQPVLFCGDHHWTYGELWDRATGIARHLLHDRRLEPGDRVGIVGANDRTYLAAYLGVLRAGCVAVPLNAALDVEAIREQLGLVGASAVLVGELAHEAGSGLAGLLPVWRLAELAMTGSGRLPAISAAAPACVLMTSGSTGRPKGVVHTQGTLLHAALQLGSAFPFTAADRNIAFLPFYAAIPEQVLPTLCTGGALDVLPRFDVEQVARAARRATTFDAVPTVMARLLADAPLEDLSNLRWVMFASEPMPASLLQRWWEALPGVETHQLYGMTETLPITLANDRMLREEPASVGTAFASSRLSVVDGAGDVIAGGGVGEILCRSPATMHGYFGDPQATAAARTADGAMRTGDLGRLDERGRLFLTGRLKDLIISGGLNIAPAEIEAVACRYPGVISAAVVGIPDERWGETPVVVAVPAPGNGLVARDLLEHCRRELASFKRPSAAGVVQALPSTGIGKSAKAVIRRQILDGEIELVRTN